MWGSYGPAGTQMQDVVLLREVEQVAANFKFCEPVGIAGSAGSGQQMGMQQALPNLETQQTAQQRPAEWVGILPS